MKQLCSECKQVKVCIRWGGQDICSDCNETTRREVEQSLEMRLTGLYRVDIIIGENPETV